LHKGKRRDPNDSRWEKWAQMAAQTRLKNNPRPWYEKEWIYQEYIVKNKTLSKIASDAGFPEARGSIRNWIIRHGIKLRSRGESAHIRGNKYDFVYRVGYATVNVPNKNGRGTRKFIHRMISESALGRELKNGEVVHHINGNEKDNRNNNLLICDNAYHQWLHQEMSRRYAIEHFGG